MAQIRRRCSRPFVVALCISALVAAAPLVGAFASSSTSRKTRMSSMMMFSGGGREGECGNDEEPNDSTAAKLGTYNPLRLAVLKLGFTELRWTSPLNYEKRDGDYNCANCGTKLFDAEGKYDSGSGWPSFFRTAEGNVALFREWDGRVECRCGACGGHLGHVFPDGPRRKDIIDGGILQNIPESDLRVGDPSSENSRLPRYCMNGAALKFKQNE